MGTLPGRADDLEDELHSCGSGPDRLPMEGTRRQVWCVGSPWSLRNRPGTSTIGYGVVSVVRTRWTTWSCYTPTATDRYTHGREIDRTSRVLRGRLGKASAVGSGGFMYRSQGAGRHQCLPATRRRGHGDASVWCAIHRDLSLAGGTGSQSSHQSRCPLFCGQYPTGFSAFPGRPPGPVSPLCPAW